VNAIGSVVDPNRARNFDLNARERERERERESERKNTTANLNTSLGAHTFRESVYSIESRNKS
jgi:hypothetical protein